MSCLLYTSDAADEISRVDLGGRRIIKKKTQMGTGERSTRFGDGRFGSGLAVATRCVLFMGQSAWV